ncbi:MAG: hypothetical protein ACO2ZL_02845 [Flavobacteriales bacterium]
MNFPIKIFAANAALYGMGLLIPVFEGFASTWAWALIIMGYGFLALALNRWITVAADRSPIQFVTAVNGSTALKMFTSLAGVLVYLVFIGGEFRVHFVMGLFSAFALNTTLLVIESQKLSSKG